MAEEKKPAKSDGGNNIKASEQIIALIAGLLLLAALTNAVLSFLGTLDTGIHSSIWEAMTVYFLTKIWPTWKLVAAIVSGFALVGIIYNLKKTRDIDIEEQPIYNPEPQGSLSSGQIKESPKNEKWEKIMVYANSSNASDWKLAILEADVMLEELLHTLGYVGESVGEILKSVDKSDFLTIEDAWEAHKIRNNVAHSGGNFELSERETKRVVALFENVFKEFQVI